MGEFIISKRKDGEFQFILQAGNGQTILNSEGYTSKTGCSAGIESVKKNAADDKKYDRKKSSNNKAYFNLKAGNGEIIGASQMYESDQARDHGIDSVKANAPAASVEDIS